MRSCAYTNFETCFAEPGVAIYKLEFLSRPRAECIRRGMPMRLIGGRLVRT
jgi:hypothetical protein